MVLKPSQTGGCYVALRGIDLHSNNHVVIVMDEEDNKVVDKRIDNNLTATLELLAPPLCQDKCRAHFSINKNRGRGMINETLFPRT